MFFLYIINLSHCKLMWIKLKSSVVQVLRVALDCTNATSQWLSSKTFSEGCWLNLCLIKIQFFNSYLSSCLFMKNGLNVHASPCFSRTFWSHNLQTYCSFCYWEARPECLMGGQCHASELCGPVPSLCCHWHDLGRNGVCPHHFSAILVPSELPVFVTRLLFLAQRRHLSRRIWGNARTSFQSQPQLGHLQPAIKKHPLTSDVCVMAKGFLLSLEKLQHIPCAVMMCLMWGLPVVASLLPLILD